MVRPKLDPAAKTEAAAAREAELTPRRDTLRAVGNALHGSRWIADLASDLGRVAERQSSVGPSRNGMRSTAPIPSWAMDSLGQLAREGAATLRRRADDLDAAFPGSKEPPGSEEPPAQADDDGYDPFDIDANRAAQMSKATPSIEVEQHDDAEVDAILKDLCSREPQPKPTPVEARPTTWTSKARRQGIVR